MGNVFKRFFFFLFLHVFVYLEFSSYKFDILRALVVGVNLFSSNNTCKGTQQNVPRMFYICCDQTYAYNSYVSDVKHASSKPFAKHMCINACIYKHTCTISSFYVCVTHVIQELFMWAFFHMYFVRYFNTCVKKNLAIKYVCKWLKLYV